MRPQDANKNRRKLFHTMVLTNFNVFSFFVSSDSFNRHAYDDGVADGVVVTVDLGKVEFLMLIDSNFTVLITNKN